MALVKMIVICECKTRSCDNLLKIETSRVFSGGNQTDHFADRCRTDDELNEIAVCDKLNLHVDISLELSIG
jgi:hypothetical protein